MKPTRVILVRHGEADINAAHVLSSAAPGSPLTPRGIEQARTLAGALGREGVIHVYTSPVLRALQTAALLSEALEVDMTISAGLREFSLGLREGTPGTNQDVITHPAFDGWLAGNHLERRFEGGESGTEIVDRMSTALDQASARRPGATVLAVSHGGAISVALTNLCPDLDPDLVRREFPDNCAAVFLEHRTHGWRCVTWPTRSALADDMT